MCKQDNFTDVKKHLLNIRKNCGLRRCGEEMGKQRVRSARGQEEQWRRANTVPERTVGAQHGGKPHKHAESDVPFPCPLSLVAQALGHHARTTPTWENENFPPATKTGPLHLRLRLRPPLIPSLPGSSRSTHITATSVRQLRLGLLLGLRFSFCVFVCLFIAEK